MQQSKGFGGFTMERDGNEYTVVSKWETIPDWEAYSCSVDARRSHLPLVGALGQVAKCMHVILNC